MLLSGEIRCSILVHKASIYLIAVHEKSMAILTLIKIGTGTAVAAKVSRSLVLRTLCTKEIGHAIVRTQRVRRGVSPPEGPDLGISLGM